jgi:hypothetical protein
MLAGHIKTSAGVKIWAEENAVEAIVGREASGANLGPRVALGATSAKSCTVQFKAAAFPENNETSLGIKIRSTFFDACQPPVALYATTATGPADARVSSPR